MTPTPTEPASTIVLALDGHPEARDAVVAGLQALDLLPEPGQEPQE